MIFRFTLLLLGLMSSPLLACSSADSNDADDDEDGDDDGDLGGAEPDAAGPTGGSWNTGATGSSGTGGAGTIAPGATGAAASANSWVTGGSTGQGSAASGGTTGAGGSPGSGGGSTFSFFVASLAKMRELSGSSDGFGGDLRFGEATGLAGADKICTTIAESVEPGNGRTWRAFLSTSSQDAIDRIGAGPWYDILGRRVATDIDGLLGADRPEADEAIVNDLPDETGTGLSEYGDYHDILTGSRSDGRYEGREATCLDWTSSTRNAGQPRIGHSFPRSMGGRNGAANWISDHTAPGCAPGVVSGNEMDGGCVGCGGGYGGIYCFAL